MYSLKNRANAVFFHFFVVMGFLAGFNWLSCAFQRGQPVGVRFEAQEAVKL